MQRRFQLLIFLPNISILIVILNTTIYLLLLFLPIPVVDNAFVVVSAEFHADVHIHAHRSDFHAVVQLLLHQLFADPVPGRGLEHRFGPGQRSSGGELFVLDWLEAHATPDAAAAARPSRWRRWHLVSTTLACYRCCGCIIDKSIFVLLVAATLRADAARGGFAVNHAQGTAIQKRLPLARAGRSTRKLYKGVAGASPLVVDGRRRHSWVF